MTSNDIIPVLPDKAGALVDQPREIKKEGATGSVKKRGLIVRRNDLIMGKYRLTTQEMRLFYWLMSEISPNDEAFKSYRLGIKEFASVVGLEGDSIYSTIPVITRRLMQRVVELNDLDEKVLRQRHLVSAANYKYGEGYVELELHPDMKTYLLNVKDHFTVTDFQIAMRLRGTHSMRLYDVLKAENWKGGESTFAVQELRDLLGIDDKEYQRFNNFKARVLEPATKEISDRTDLEVSYSTTKTGWAVDKVSFRVTDRGKLFGYPAGTRKDKLYKMLRDVGMPENEAMKAIADWADDDHGRIEYHVNECKTKKTPLAWLRAGLKADYRPNRPLLAEIAEMKVKAEETRNDYKPIADASRDDAVKRALQDLYNRE